MISPSYPDYIATYHHYGLFYAIYTPLNQTKNTLNPITSNLLMIKLPENLSSTKNNPSQGTQVCNMQSAVGTFLPSHLAFRRSSTWSLGSLHRYIPISSNVGKTIVINQPWLGMVNITITPVKMMMTVGWCKWHCFTHIIPAIYQTIKKNGLIANDGIRTATVTLCVYNIYI